MHPDDSTWRSLLDGEVTPTITAELEEHLEGCPACRLSAGVIARDRTTVRALLDSLGGPAPRRSVQEILQRARRTTSRRWALLAAMILLGMVTVAGASIATGLFQAVVERIRRPQQPDLPGQTVPRADTQFATGITLAAGESAEIVFRSRQGAGTVTISESEGSNIEIITTVSIPYAVRNGRITISNGGTNADYQITIPRRPLRVEVRVADRVLFTKLGSLITATVRPDSTGKYVLPFP